MRGQGQEGRGRETKKRGVGCLPEVPEAGGEESTGESVSVKKQGRPQQEDGAPAKPPEAATRICPSRSPGQSVRSADGPSGPR